MQFASHFALFCGNFLQLNQVPVPNYADLAQPNAPVTVVNRRPDNRQPGTIQGQDANLYAGIKSA
jgi:hypothetical protein